MFGIKPLAILVLLTQLFQFTNGLHFYLNTNEQRCFFEELPKDTLLVAKVEALELDGSNNYVANNNLKLKFTVSETFDNDRQVVNQKGVSRGDITFTSLDAGEHKFCLQPFYYDGTSSRKHRIFFDIAIGSAHDYIDSKSTNQVDQLTARIQDLNKKLEQINFEQEQIREREAVFRNQSENTNSRVIFWTFIQLSVLIGTCLYQLKHLKSFFVKQKIV